MAAPGAPRSAACAQMQPAEFLLLRPSGTPRQASAGHARGTATACFRALPWHPARLRACRQPFVPPKAVQTGPLSLPSGGGTLMLLRDFRSLGASARCSMPRGFPLKPNYGVMALFCCRWPRFSKKGSGQGSMPQPAKPDRSPQQITFANGIPKGYGTPFSTLLRPRCAPVAGMIAWTNDASVLTTGMCAHSRQSSFKATML